MGLIAALASAVLASAKDLVSKRLASRLDGTVTIPMVGRTESLNVGMAAAVLCFERARQCRARSGADER